METNKIFCAVDDKNLNSAFNLCESIKKYIGGIKLGLEFFSANGPEGVKKISSLNIPIFLDLKFLDIENTVIKAIESLDGLPVEYLSIHISNGKKTLIKAQQKANELSKPIKLLGITVLTSFSANTLNEIGIKNTLEEQVKNLASLAKSSGLYGVVCSPHEIKLVKSISENFKIFTPGIRPKESEKEDQERTMTPKEALNSGADHIIIGRPITKGNPLQNIKKILQSLN